MNKAAGSVNRYLLGGTLASVVASVCCLGPFLLLATGFSAAWMSQLMALEPLQPYFTVLALILFAFAGGKLFVAQLAVDGHGHCDIARISSLQKTGFLLCGTIALVLLTSSYWIPLLP